MQNKLIIGYPRSFLRFILLSYGLVSLPLLLAAVYSAITLSTLAQQNTRAVRDATQAIHLSRDLESRLTEMERGLRQYAVLEDPALLAEFRSNGQAFNALLEKLAALQPTQGVEQPLYPLVRQAIEQSQPMPDERVEEGAVTGIHRALNALEELENTLPGVIQRVEKNIGTEIANNETLAATTQTSLMISLLVSVILAALIILMFRRQIGTLMRQF